MASDLSDEEFADMVATRDFASDELPKEFKDTDAVDMPLPASPDTDSKRRGSPAAEEENKEDGPSKRRKTSSQEEEEDTVKIAEPSHFVAQTKATQSQEALYVKTLNVSDFSVQLNSMCSLPNVESIFIKFDETGMTMYCHPKQSPTIAISFWNRNTFEKYECKGEIKKWVSKDRLASLKKKISKDVKFLEVTLNQDSPGFCFSGYRTYDQGDGGNFSHNVYEWMNTEKPMNIPCQYKWHVTTSSKKFKDNVDFIDDKNEFIGLNIMDKKLTFRGLVGEGDVAEKIDHETFTSISKEFYVLFYKKYLKVVTSAHGLNKSMTISFSDENQYVPPTLFTYALDKEQPQSHFSVYIVPIPKQ